MTENKDEVPNQAPSTVPTPTVVSTEPVETDLPQDDLPLDAIEAPSSASVPDDTAQVAVETTQEDSVEILAVETTDSEETDQSESAVGEGDESRVPNRRILNPNPHVELSKPVKGPLKPGVKLGENDHLTILGTDIPELNALAENYPNVDLGRSDDGARWLSSIQDAQRYLMRGNALLSSLTRDESLWRQSVTAGAEQLQAGRPKFGENTDGQRLVGEQAVMRMQSLLGLGSVVRVPLWHSGIWITLKAPTEASLLELDRRMAAEKVLLGRATYGLIFANSSVYTTSFLVNFVLAHVYEASARYTKIDELKSIIKVTDIPTLLWGLVCSIYPNGYPFMQPCVTDPTKCTHVTQELLNVSKLSWTDDRSLTDWQRRQMIRKNAKFPPEELKRYEEEHKSRNYATVKLHDKLAMELKVPTIEEYETSGFAWVDSVTKQVDQAFGGTLKGDDRNRFINEQGQISALRQYSHWISRLVLEENQVIDDQATIEDMIATMTSDDDVFKKFMEGIGKFIDNATISMIAIPKYDCPACGAPQVDEEAQRHPFLIPLDIANIFFTLLDHRIYRALLRSQQ